MADYSPPALNRASIQIVRISQSFAQLRRPAVLFACLAAIILIVPAFVFGPWLPLIDLVSFVGMNGYPARESYGPLHYATFQFTYVGHYAISRFWSDLHLPLQYQVVGFYLLQAGVCFVVVWRSLERIVQQEWLRCVGVALGSLAFWDANFLWGGPLAYSLAGTCISLATLFVLREGSHARQRFGWPIAILVGFSMVCHPFAAPFALVLCGMRFVFVPDRRLWTAAVAVGVILFAYVIVQDSPASESITATHALTLLFGFDLSQIGKRVIDLFTHDLAFVNGLFGYMPSSSAILIRVLAIVHAAGFLLCPFVVIWARDNVWLRMTGILNAVVGMMYLLSRDVPGAPIPEWPQRILTVYAPITFVGGFAAIVFFLTRWKTRIGKPEFRMPKIAWAVPAFLLLFVLQVQADVFGLGRTVAANITRVRNEVLNSDISNAYVVVSNIDAIRPFYLRCVPFILFSDPKLIAKHLLVCTEWHFQDRHPSRITETAFNLGRTRYQAIFSTTTQGIHVQLVEHSQPRFPVIEHTNETRWGNRGELARAQITQARKLLDSGFSEAALEHYNTAAYLVPTNATAWNDGGVILFAAGKLEDSLSYFQNAVTNDPNLFEAEKNLGVTLLKLKRPTDAIPRLEEALKLHPGDSVVQRTLDEANEAMRQHAP